MQVRARAESAPMKQSLPILLTFNGGYVDTAGFLAFQGLFTAHVTGNFVTLGAALVLGTGGIVNKLIALPVFCLVVALVRMLGLLFSARRWSELRLLLDLKFLLLLAGAALVIWLGPFANGDAWPALVSGMTLVSAMAVQNAAQRLHLGSVPPTTLMTGNTTQLVIDLVDMFRGVSDILANRTRLVRLAITVAVFALGCGAAALLFSTVSMWCFAVPPVIALMATLLRAESQ